MTDTTTEPENKTAPDGAAPPLVIPKLRPKFHVIHYAGEDVKRRSAVLASGIAQIDDAVRIAWALAEGRTTGSTMVYAVIHRGKRPHRYNRESMIVASVPCDYARRKLRSSYDEIASAKRSLQKWAEEFGQSDRRHTWINTVLGGHDRFMEMHGDAAFRSAFYGNDFPRAWSRVLQLEAERQVAA